MTRGSIPRVVRRKTFHLSSCQSTPERERQVELRSPEVSSSPHFVVLEQWDVRSPERLPLSPESARNWGKPSSFLPHWTVPETWMPLLDRPGPAGLWATSHQLL